MKVDRREVEHVALLARIDLDEAEKDAYAGELTEILEFFDRLQEVDTRGVPATSHVLDPVEVLRTDESRPSLNLEETLRNAPDPAGRFFRVPRILD